jgi:hypothetical protein
MPILSLDQAKPGMILAEPVFTHQERLLMEAGRRLTQKNLRVFKSWGVATVAVKGVREGRRERASSDSLEGIDERLRARFADVLPDDVMAAVMAAASRQLARRPRKKSGNHE